MAITPENAPEGFAIRVSTNPHDFGAYYSVGADYSEDSERGLELALYLESESPEQWDAEARAQLGLGPTEDELRAARVKQADESAERMTVNRYRMGGYKRADDTEEDIADALECSVSWSNLENDPHGLWATHGAMTFGDYDNSCHVERANVRAFAQDFADGEGVWWVDLYGGHGSKGILLYLPRVPDEAAEAVASLDEYPCLSDDLASEVETELVDEAWGNCYSSDVTRALEQEGADLSAVTPEALREWFETWRETANEYWAIESGGDAYIRVDRIIARADDWPEGAVDATEDDTATATA
jgi:hypothetical protein